MPKLPKVIASSVIRSTHQGESHGGAYIVDLETGSYERVIDWNDDSIDWEGRGGDRGLRGIAFHKDMIYLVASDEVFVYDTDFRLIASYRNAYLKHCHETFVSNGSLFLTSTGFDSILEFDLETKSFVKGYCLRYGTIGSRLNKFCRRLDKDFYRVRRSPLPNLSTFDPNAVGGPQPGDTIHINTVFCRDGKIFISGTGLGQLLYIQNSRLRSYAKVPYTTHNTRPFREGTLLNHTSANRVVYLDRAGHVREAFPIKKYEEEELEMTNISKDHARQGFGRGLCVTKDDLIIGGSSPATISVYQLGSSKPLKTVNITMDVRNALHGLEIWPY